MTTVTVREHSRQELPDISQGEISYLRKECFKHGTTYRLNRDAFSNRLQIENGSYSGIIQLDSFRILFSTKVKANLFYMLSFLKDEKKFFYDPEVTIDIQEGNFFFDILGRLFINELDEIFRKGFYKKYVRKEEDIKFLRGKLLVNSQMANDVKKKAKFSCSFDELTFNNLENQIILRATTLLIPLIRFNNKIKRDLIGYSYLLREEVSIVNITPEDCDKVGYNRLNDYYEPIIKFSKIILQNYFIRSTRKGKSKGFNFIVNMNKVYEDFISEVIEDIVNNDPAFDEYLVERQERFDSIFREKGITYRPDVVLRRKDTDEHPLIIDVKYKLRENSADYNQMGLYALTIPDSQKCCLIYPMDENNAEEGIRHLRRDITNPERGEIPIQTVKIDLFLDTQNGDLEFDEYMDKIRHEVKDRLRSCL